MHSFTALLAAESRQPFFDLHEVTAQDEQRREQSEVSRSVDEDDEQNHPSDEADQIALDPQYASPSMMFSSLMPRRISSLATLTWL